MAELNNNAPTFGSSYGDKLFWVYTKDKKFLFYITETDLYTSEVKGNTYLESTAKLYTKEEWLDKAKPLMSKYRKLFLLINKL